MEGQSEIISEERRFGSHQTEAVLNPSVSDFQKLLDQFPSSVLEIGCGGKEPRMSWKLRSGQIWVGCDPAINTLDRRIVIKNGSSILVHNGGHQPSPNSKLAVFSTIAASIPKFYPDVILAVAPNPDEVSDDQVFNYDLERFIDPRGKRQTVIITMDKRTWESDKHLKSAKKTIEAWMKRNRFEHNPESGEKAYYKPNSRDLGGIGANITKTFTRNG